MQNTIKFNGLDHLRALAIVLVFIYHYRMFPHPAWIDTVGWIGWTGVDLFFVISGFLISSQLFQETGKHGTIRLNIFFTKRFFRIIPPYIFTLALYFCLPVFREREALPAFWKFVSFTQNFGLNVIDKGTFSHAWSLCIEEQFYLILPFLLLFLGKFRSIRFVIPGAVFLIIASLALRYYAWHEYAVPNSSSPDFWKVWYMKIYYPTYTRFDGLAVGVLIGCLHQYFPRLRSFIHAKGNMLLIIGLLSVALSLFFCRDQYSEDASVFGFTLIAISYGLVLMGAISGSSFLGRKSYFLTSYLAVLSYSIYLSHKGIIHLVQLFTDQSIFPASGSSMFIICFLACLGGGLFYRYVIEKPSALFKNKILDNQQYKIARKKFKR
ncbi:peptidoglycan/LPS O-acetylase OafA/YrhL [Chryseobacterium sp. SORGH_AS 447]|uniref:acyltransferase family protein n=1 Tax=Chryseobacterium sp. SORGH_AS_0447 TaxID=3041769 RepID=UPI0027803575|nr:acyltransferase [Chryseobacterium sp. SORGH_AS_0447]MDQ1162401.1 peptidoglycan/LPS O-acetylase OafA/YrhL [Chryseobacterium sp. SORGH_AS_0447]